VLTSPFIPMLFQGEEWGASTPFLYFSGHPEPELGYAVSEGRKREFAAFGWDPAEIPDPQLPETFTRSKLDWAEITREPHAGLLRWHRDLIRLRKQSPDLTDGRLDRVRAQFSEEEKWLTMQRGEIAVLCNFNDKTQRVPLADASRFESLLQSRGGVHLAIDGAEMPPESVAILRAAS
jgi:maltooligosyltrehalose trehalohydrolase